MAGTTNFQLEKYVNQRKELLSNQVFLGVFPSDELPDGNRKNACLIANYSSSTAAGTHWVAMRMLNSARPEYFDSYGLHPDQADALLGIQTGFTDYLQKHSTTGQFDYNTFDLQSWKGDTECGEWAVWFILHGMPSLSNPAWVTYLKEKDAHKRDLMIRSRLGLKSLDSI